MLRVGLLLLFALSVVAQEPTHPLDPLSADEIRTVVKALDSVRPADSEFSLITLKEPAKAEVLAFRDGSKFDRHAFVVVYDRAANRTYEAIVDCRRGAVLQWRNVPGVQSMYLARDTDVVNKVLCTDETWKAALKRRGISVADCADIYVDQWAGGYYGIPGEENRRVIRAVPYLKRGVANPYAKPIEGLYAFIDVGAAKILKLIDTGVVAVPSATADFKGEPGLSCESNPDKSTFDVRGNEVSWHNWRFRYAMLPRDGLVLYNVGYQDHGKPRSILYRASLSEMVVPYADPSEGWFFRNAFDEGEYGMGLQITSLRPGGEVPSDARTFAAVMANSDGTVKTVPCAFAMYERDGGIAWRHYEDASDSTEASRSRELVVTWFTTVSNYDYGFSWIFHDDGTIEMDTVLTGIDEPKAIDSNSQSHGSALHSSHLIARDIQGVHHQHFFNFRLDFDLDTPANNSIVELNTESVPMDSGNPYGNAFTLSETVLHNEKDARRNVNLGSSRTWKIINQAVLNSLGQPVGYALATGESSFPYAALDSWTRRRARFLDAQLWVTPYSPDEMYAAGEYVNQSKGGGGLPTWTAWNRSIEKQDVVIWYTFGITHIPRPEDWPVMPAHHAGFKLIPDGFFSQNPTVTETSAQH